MLSQQSRDDWNQHWADYANSAEVNPAQKFRRRLLVSWIKRFAGSDLRILDIGSGQGDLVADLRRELPRAGLLGIDVSPVGAEMARRKAPDAHFLVADLLQPGEVHPDWRCWASAAVCSEVLEHVDEPEKLLKGAAEYMAPGSYLFITVPGGPMSAFDRYIGHRRHFTSKILERVIADAGFEPVYAAGTGFPFFNLYRLMVIARGKGLIERARLGANQLQPAERAAASLFDLFFDAA